MGTRNDTKTVNITVVTCDMCNTDIGEVYAHDIPVVENSPYQGVPTEKRVVCGDTECVAEAVRAIAPLLKGYERLVYSRGFLAKECKECGRPARYRPMHQGRLCDDCAAAEEEEKALLGHE